MVGKEIVLDLQISFKGTKIDKAQIDVINKLPPTTNVNGVRSFLGLVEFYRQFIHDFSLINKPLCNLLVKDIQHLSFK